jgi:thiamine biosynthesis lipoprotein
MAAPTTAEATFRAMGSDAHLIVVGADAEALLTTASDRIDDLERRWSRFLPDSEISRANRNAGRSVVVSPETVELVRRAVEAWRLTGAAFDPLVLPDVVAAGYDRSFDEIVERGPTAPAPRAVTACTDIEIDGDRITIPAGAGFDPGGIGKGLAADIVTTELRAAGAAGTCVNLGGDLRVDGVPPDGAAWTVAVEHQAVDRPVVLLGLAAGAVATSTTLRRRWTIDGVERHHLVDPQTGAPSTSDLAHVTVVAAHAWVAEVLAKAVLLRGSPHQFDLLGGTGAEALAVDRDGVITVSPGFAAFAGDAVLPGVLIP